MDKISVTSIQIIPLNPREGLCFFSTCIINNQFFIGNIAGYSSANSLLGYRLVFPQKRLANGRVVNIFFPISRDVEQEVSAAIIKKYVVLMENFHNVEVI